MYNIYIRDSNFKRVGEVTDFSKLELIPRFNAVGSFVLDLPTDCPAARELIKDKAGIIVKKDGNNIFSGTVISRYRKWDSSGDTMTLSGKDDNWYIAKMLAWPEINGGFNLQDYDVRTGSAETVMKQYVEYNCGPSAFPGRKMLTVEADVGMGLSVTGSARFDNLLDFLSSLALRGGGLGFKVVQDGNELVFQVYQPTDKTRSVFFSPLLGNLSSFEYSNIAPDSNAVVIGGSGEGAARYIMWKDNAESIIKYSRIETFVDQRNTLDETELVKSMDEELINKAEKNSFSFTPIDTPQLSFGKEYGLGDKVSIVLTQPNEVIDVETLHYFISAFQTVPTQQERVRKIQEKLDVIHDIVREVKLSITPEGGSISPVVGTQDSNNNAILGIFDKMKKLSKRLSNLERR